MKTENNVAAQAGDEPMRENLALVIARLEQIAGNLTDDPRNAAEEALVCARSIASQVSPRATADVEREKETNTLRTWLSYALRQSECDMVLTGEECRRISAVLATTKPGA